MTSPLSVWAWTPTLAGAGAPADPEEEEESARRVGPEPVTWNEEEETNFSETTKTSVCKTVKLKLQSVVLFVFTFSTWWIFTLASGGCCTLTFTKEGLGAAHTHIYFSFAY